MQSSRSWHKEFKKTFLVFLYKKSIIYNFQTVFASSRTGIFLILKHFLGGWRDSNPWGRESCELIIELQPIPLYLLRALCTVETGNLAKSSVTDWLEDDKSKEHFPEKVLALHLALEAGDVSVAEVLAELLHLLQLQQVDPQHLYGPDHLERGHRFIQKLIKLIQVLKNDH